jgi:serine/threonine-protein kinase
MKAGVNADENPDQSPAEGDAASQKARLERQSRTASTIEDPGTRAVRPEPGAVAPGELSATVPVGGPSDPAATVERRAPETEIVDGSCDETVGEYGEGVLTTPEDSPSVGTDGPAASSSDQFIPDSRYRPVRPHAQGGIGLVWLAQDCQLQREVALKVIQPQFSKRQDQRARFLLEAEITGKLEHPGIVPVYSLGRDAEGRPYYAMRFIRGESLSAAIRRFHGEPGRTSAGSRRKARRANSTPLAFRELLRRFIDVCNAIDYAHSRGVLHRDLKPSNIMLGSYGETLVVDWGLAKVVGSGDIPPVEAGPGGRVESSLAPSMTASSGETAPGTTLGTPAYMSPEQASGLADQIGPASDVYGLGATLYELLTGQVAFSGGKMGELIDRVQRGDFSPPRSVERSLPAPLEAICLKAMALKPEDRYPSVRALARDLEHWLADEPVTAYPERPLERMARWLRQHRSWTYSAIAGLAAVCLVTTIALVVLDGARRSESAARQEAQMNFIMAQGAVNAYLTNVSENTLLQEQDSVDLRRLRRQLLESALQYYRGFVNQRSKDPRLKKDLASAYYRVGKITEEIGSVPDAAAALEAARANFEELAAANPSDDELQGDLGACNLAIGRLSQLRLGNLRAALQSLDRARAILKPLVARHRDVAAYQSNLALCLSELGVVQARLGDTTRALSALDEARTILNGLIARLPDQIGYESIQAEVINNIGFVQQKQGDNRAALKSFLELRDHSQTLLDSITVGPRPVWLLNRLAKTDYNIGTVQIRTGERDAALRSFEQSLGFRQELALTHPSVAEYREHLGESYREIAWVLVEDHQNAKALPYLEKSLEIFQKLVKAHPDRAKFVSDLGLCWNSLGCMHDEARDNARALSDFEQAVNELERASKASPETSDYKFYLNMHLQNVGEQYVDMGQPDAGLPYYKRGLEILRDLHQTDPRNAEYSLQYVDALLMLANVERHAGEPAAGVESFALAHQLLDRLVAEDPANAEIAVRLATSVVGQALATAEVQGPAAARPLLTRAVEVLSPLVPTGRSPSPERGLLSEALWYLARVDRALNQPAGAAHADFPAAGLWNDRPAAELANLALKEVGQAALIGYGKTPISGRARAVRDLDLDLAAAHLRLAISHGFTDLKRLEAHPDFGVLLTHADLKALVERLGFQGRAAGMKP